MLRSHGLFRRHERAATDRPSGGDRHRTWDDEQERLDKAVTTLSTCLITALSTVWVVTYFSLELPVAATIPLVYQVISIGSLAVFARTKRLRFFRMSQLAMMLMLPFFLQLSLGGFVPSSAVML